MCIKESLGPSEAFDAARAGREAVDTQGLGCGAGLGVVIGSAIRGLF